MDIYIKGNDSHFVDNQGILGCGILKILRSYSSMTQGLCWVIRTHQQSILQSARNISVFNYFYIFVLLI